MIFETYSDQNYIQQTKILFEYGSFEMYDGGGELRKHIIDYDNFSIDIYSEYWSYDSQIILFCLNEKINYYLTEHDVLTKDERKSFKSSERNILNKLNKFLRNKKIDLYI
jgi:hypothetical protein